MGDDLFGGGPDLYGGPGADGPDLYGGPGAGGPDLYGSRRGRPSVSDLMHADLSGVQRLTEPGDPPGSVRDPEDPSIIIMADGTRRDTSHWYPMPLADPESDDIKFGPTLERDQESYKARQRWQPNVYQLDEMEKPWPGQRSGALDRMWAVQIPGEQDPRKLHRHQASEWQKQEDETWLAYKNRMLVKMQASELTRTEELTARARGVHRDPMVAVDAAGQEMSRPMSDVARKMSPEERAGRGIQLVTADPDENFGEFMTRQLWSGVTAPVGLATELAVAPFSEEAAGAVHEFLHPAGSGDPGVLYNLLRGLGSIPGYVASEVAAPVLMDALTPEGADFGVWGKIAEYASERSEIRGEERRVLNLKRGEKGFTEELEAAPIWATVTRDPVSGKWHETAPNGAKYAREFWSWKTDKFWENTGNQFEGLIMLLPAAYSAAGFLASRRDTAEKLSEVGKFPMEIAGHVGAHLGTLGKGRLDDYLNEGLVSAVADPLIVVAPIHRLLLRRSNQLVGQAELMRGGRMGTEGRIAQSGDNIAAMIRRRQLQLTVHEDTLRKMAEAAQRGVEAGAPVVDAGVDAILNNLGVVPRGEFAETLSGWAKTPQAARVIDEMSLLSDQIVRLRTMHSHWEAARGGKLTQAQIETMPVEVFENEVVIPRRINRKTGELEPRERYMDPRTGEYRTPIELLDDLSDAMASEDAAIIRYRQWLNEWEPEFLYTPKDALKSKTLNRWIMETGEPKSRLKKAVKDKKLDQVPDEVLWRMRVRIRGFYTETADIEGLTLLESRLNKVVLAAAPEAVSSGALGEVGTAALEDFIPPYLRGTVKPPGTTYRPTDPPVVFREAGQDIGALGMEALNKEGMAYRGMTEAEYLNTVNKDGLVRSRRDYSVSGEGTSFADDIRDAESYVNVGRDNPRLTRKPTYIVEVSKEHLSKSPDGYWKTSEPTAVSGRVWRITSSADDADLAVRTAKGPASLVGREVTPPPSAAPAAPTKGQWMPPGARVAPKVPKFVVEEMFARPEYDLAEALVDGLPKPWLMTKKAFAKEWGALRARLRATGKFNKDLEARMDMGEVIYNDLRSVRAAVEEAQAEAVAAQILEDLLTKEMGLRAQLKVAKGDAVAQRELRPLMADAKTQIKAFVAENAEALGVTPASKLTAAQLTKKARARIRQRLKPRETERVTARPEPEWTEQEIADLMRARQMAGGQSILSSPKPEAVWANLRQLKKRGVIGADESAAIDMAETIKSHKAAYKQAVKSAAELRQMAADVRASVEYETVTRRAKGLSDTEVALLDQAEMVAGQADMLATVMRYMDPFAPITSLNRFKNNWFDRYGVKQSKYLSKELEFQNTWMHEVASYSRYYLRNRKNANLVGINALKRAAEAEVTSFAFRSQQFLKDIAEVVTHEVQPGETLRSIAGRYRVSPRKIVRHNKLDMLRRKVDGTSEFGRLPEEFSTHARAAKEFRTLIGRTGVKFWEGLSDDVLLAYEDVINLMFDHMAKQGSGTHATLMRSYVKSIQGYTERLGFVDKAVHGARRQFEKQVRWVDQTLRRARVRPKDITLRVGDRIKVRTTFEKEKRMTTVFQALHYEHANVTANTIRDHTAPAGKRFRVSENAKDVEQWAEWVRIANQYDQALDFSMELTLQSIQAKILQETRGLHDVWASNFYTREERYAALEKRLRDDLAEKQKNGWKPSNTELKDAERNVREMLREFEMVEDHAVSHRTMSGVRGAAAQTRKLGRIDPTTGKPVVPIEQRIANYGMSSDLHSTILQGMMNQKRDIATANMWRRISEDQTMYSVVRRPGWVKVNNSGVPGTKLKKFGNQLPDEFYMHPDIYYDFAGMEQMLRHSGWWLTKGLSYWKAFKTALNPATHMTNMLSNALFLGPMHGISPLNPFDSMVFRMAAKEFGLGTHSAHWQAFIKSGGSPAGALNRLEMVVDANKAFANAYHGVSGKGRLAMESLAKLAEDTMSGEFRGAARHLKELTYDLPGMMYQAEDDFFRFALFLKRTGRGMGKAERLRLQSTGHKFMSDVEAAELSRKAFARYEELAGAIRFMSISPLGKPFLAFDATMVPQFHTWMKTNPTQARLWMQLYEQMTDINFAQSNMTRKRADEYQKNLPGFDIRRMAMLRKLAPSLAESDAGGERYWNVLRYGIGTRLLKESGESTTEWGMRQMMSEHPGLSVISYVFGYHPKFRIKYSFDDPSYGDRVIESVAQTLLPTWFPQIPGTDIKGYMWQRINDSGFRFFGEREPGKPRYGRGIEEEPWQAFMAVFAGQNIPEYDPVLRLEQKAREHGYALSGQQRTGIAAEMDKMVRSYERGTHRYIKTREQLHDALMDIAPKVEEAKKAAGSTLPPIDINERVALAHENRVKGVKERSDKFAARAISYRQAGRHEVYDAVKSQRKLDRAKKDRNKILEDAEKTFLRDKKRTGFYSAMEWITEVEPDMGSQWAEEARQKTIKASILALTKIEGSYGARQRAIKEAAELLITLKKKFGEGEGLEKWYNSIAEGIRRQQVKLQKEQGQ